MAINDQEIKLIIKAIKEGQGLEQTIDALNKMQESGKKSGESINQLTGFFKGLLPALSAAAVVAAMKGMADAAIESEREGRILTQTIKNLGLENKVTIDSVKDFAQKMMDWSGVNDEEVIRSFNTLLKVTKDAPASFNLVKLAMDMSSGSGKSLSETTEALSMAVLGNARGLRQYGIEVGTNIPITEALRKAVELYGGQTEKLGNTAEGSIRKAKTAFGELGETSGRVFLPMLGWLASVGTAMIKFAEVQVKGLILNMQEFGNICKGVFDAVVSRDFGKFKVALEENKKLEAQHTKDVIDLYQKQSDKKEKISTNLSTILGLNIKKDEAAEQAKAKKDQERIDKKSKAEQEYWDREIKLAGDDRDKLKIIEGKITNDKHLQHNERVKLIDKLHDHELEQAKETAKLMASSFMAAATGSENAVEKLAKDITKTLVTKAFIPMAKGLNSMLGQFGDIGTVLAGGVGGVIGMAVGGFLNLLGGQSKSVAEYTKEAYDKMVQKTNEKLDEIGREKTKISKAVDIVETLGKGLFGPEQVNKLKEQLKAGTITKNQYNEAVRAGQAKAYFGASTQATAIKEVAGIDIVGMTQSQALKALYAKAGQLPSEYKTLKNEKTALELQLPFEQLKATLPGTNTTEQRGKVAALKTRIAEINTLLGVAELEAAQEKLDLAQKIAALPKYQSGGVVQETGPALVHKGETIIPAGGSSETHIHISVGAFMGTESDALQFAKLIAYYNKKIERRNLTV
jgi:hypothetical protein